MPSGLLEPLRRNIGLRLSLLYALIFTLSSVALLALAYYLLAAAVGSKDREVRRGSEQVELQPREFALLEYLMRHPNRPVTKTMILEHIFDYSFDPQTNVVDVLVHRLRSKVDRGHSLIQTIRGVGYVFRPA